MSPYMEWMDGVLRKRRTLQQVLLPLFCHMTRCKRADDTIFSQRFSPRPVDMKVILICSVEYLGDTVIAGKFQKLPKEIVLTEIAAVFRIVTDCLLLQLINKRTS